MEARLRNARQPGQDEPEIDPQDLLTIMEQEAEETVLQIIGEWEDDIGLFRKILVAAIGVVNKCGHGPEAARAIMGLATRHIFAGSKNLQTPIPARMEELFGSAFAYKAPQCTWDVCMNRQEPTDYGSTGQWEDTRYWKARHCEKVLHASGFHFTNHQTFRDRLVAFVEGELGQTLPNGSTWEQAADACCGVLNMEAASHDDSRHRGKTINP